MSFKYKNACVGGTFDHLHLGHKELLSTAFTFSEQVKIGLATSDLLSKKFLASLIEEYSVRETELKDFLKKEGFEDRAQIIPLKDIYGPTLDEDDLQAIFVTEETLGNAKSINKERVKRGLLPLKITTVPFKEDAEGNKITSERIRLGEIDRNGYVYMSLFKGKGQLRLPAGLRNKMRFPIGEVIKNLRETDMENCEDSFIISVGDVVSKSLKEMVCIPYIEIIDFKNQRNIIDEKAFREYKGKRYKNEPGTIQEEVVSGYREMVRIGATSREKQVMVIDGEEDLLTIPAILLGPLGSFVYYGQFDLNAVVKVEITEEKKKEVRAILEGFE